MTKLKRLLTPAALTIAACFSFPQLAFAAETEGGNTGLSLLFPALGEWIPMLVGFIILWFILAKFAWPAFIGMIDKRAEIIKDSLERAEIAKVESERLLEENRLQLEEAKRQAAQIIADAKVTGEMLRSEINEQALEEARLLVARAKAAIETEKKAAIAQLQSSVADISVSVAGRLIGQDLSDADHRRLIERYLAEAGRLDAN